MEPSRFETHPDRYRHWKLSVAGDVATLVMAVDDEHPHRPGSSSPTRSGASASSTPPSGRS